MVGSVGSFGTSVGSMLLVSFALRKMKISSMESDGVTTGRSWPLCNHVACFVCSTENEDQFYGVGWGYDGQIVAVMQPGS